MLCQPVSCTWFFSAYIVFFSHKGGGVTITHLIFLKIVPTTTNRKMIVAANNKKMKKIITDLAYHLRSDF
jgi:hypothetical protein